MVADMVKAQLQVVDILCNLKLIYPYDFFDVMIHLVIHLPQEALKGGPIPNQKMYPFERYMKKLKNMYGISLSRKVFRSICKSIGKRSVIRFDHQELKKVIWYVLHNSPEIDTYRAKFKSEFPNQYMKEEFLGWFRFHDERRTTQNSGICSPSEKDREMYYGQLEEILEFSYMLFKVVLFRVKWFDTSNKGRKIKRFVIRNNITQIWAHEDDHDVIHFNNSLDLALSTSLNDLDFATLNIDGQSMDVDTPPDIIDVDEDDDFIDDEDVLPHDLADSNDEDLANDDDDVAVMSADVAQGYDGDNGCDNRPPPRQIFTCCRALQNAQNRAKSKVFFRQGSQSLAVIRDMQMESSETREYPSLIQSYFDTHIFDGVFLQDEARIQYEEMLRLRNLGANTPTSVPYTKDQIMAMVHQGKQQGHIPGVGRVLVGQGRGIISINEPRCTHTDADVDEVKEENKKLRKKLNMLMTVVKSDDRMSQLLTQLQSQHEVGNGSGSGGGGDDEPGEDEDANEDEDADGSPGS
ncbi:EF-hand domain pair containing protein [Tanacetum coccineum]